ncbi:MAG: hypothetical protein DRI89_01620 [Bacteroidetes bacterium]|nr:MAG: hypothetical protein DRI89_01620 [Bacteroidota bacterium]
MKTKQKNTREESLSSRNFIQSILDSIPTRVVVLNQEMEIVIANQRWIDFGVENQINAETDWIGLDYLSMCQQTSGLSKKEANTVGMEISNIFSGLKEDVKLVYSCNKTGEERWFSFQAKGFNSDGKRWVTITHDEVTKQKKSIIAQVLSEERYRILSEATFEAIFFSENSVYLEQNRTAERMFGFSLSELIGENGIAWVVTEDREMVMKNILSGYRDPYEATAIRKDGSTFFAEIRGRKMLYKGKYVHVTAVSNITKQKQAENALRESENRFHSLADASMEAIFFTKNGICLDTNQLAVKMFGFKERLEMIGLLVTELVTEESKELVKYHTLNDKFEPYEVIGKRQNGSTFPISIQAKSMPYKDEGIVRVTSVMDITDRKKIELELRESEEKYRNLFTSSTDAIFLVRDNRFISYNPKTLEMFACKGSEIIGHSPTEFSPKYQPDGKLSEEKSIIKINAAKAGITQIFEWVHQQKDGTLFDAEVSLNKMTLSDGEYIHATIRNISQRKQAEKALLESESKYRSLFERSADAILIIKGDRFVDCNKATVEMLGFTNKEELLNSHPSQISPKFQADGRFSIEAANEMMDIAYKKGSHRFEWLHIRNNNEIFPVEVLLTSVNIGKERFLHTVWRDITERKQMEKDLRESENKYRTFFENNEAIILLINPDDGKIIFANIAAINFFGYSEEVLVGMYIHKINTLSTEEIAIRINDARKRKQNYYIFKFKLANDDVRDVEIYQTKLVLNNQEVFSVIVHDITERKLAEEDLINRNKELQIFYDAAVGRELKVIELKKEINKILKALGKKPKYIIPL